MAGAKKKPQTKGPELSCRTTYFAWQRAGGCHNFNGETRMSLAAFVIP